MKTSLGLAAMLAAALGIGAAALQTGHRHAAPPKAVFSFFEKDRTAIEKTLGHPLKTVPNTPQGFACDYALPGTQGARVYYASRGGGLPPSVPYPVEVSFATGTTWQKAAAIFGLPASRLQVKPFGPGVVELTGHPYRHFDVRFASQGAKYPDGTAVNANAGLPMAIVMVRSLNE